MYVYDLLLWLVFVSELGCAVFEVWTEAGETVEQWAWLTVLHVICQSPHLCYHSGDQQSICCEEKEEY